MKTVIRRYTAKGIEVRVVQYEDETGIQYHTEHDFPGVPSGDWFKEYEKARAISQAQFIAGWIERQKG